VTARKRRVLLLQHLLAVHKLAASCASSCVAATATQSHVLLAMLAFNPVPAASSTRTFSGAWVDNGEISTRSTRTDSMSDAQHLHRYSGDSEHNTINGVGNSSGIGSAIVYPELERVLQGAARATEEDLWHPKHYSTNLPDPALVLFCYSRPEYLASTLESLAHVDQIGSLSIYIAQDGNNPRVRQVVEAMGRKLFYWPRVRSFTHWMRDREPLLGKDQKGHAYVAQNYRFSLDRIFKKGHSHVIIVEDDMNFSLDFVRYFQATAPLLELDPSILAISSWNDHGLKYYTNDERRVFRTSYFPGLGWMMSSKLWAEIGSQFPLENWDHWLRQSVVNKGRDTVVCELNRNYNTGRTGANMRAAQYDLQIKPMDHSEGNVMDFGNLDYVLLAHFEAKVEQLIKDAVHVTLDLGTNSGQGHAPAGKRKPEVSDVVKEVALQHAGGIVLITYKIEQYNELSKLFGVVSFPRAHFKHIAILNVADATFLLADVRECPFLPTDLRIFPSPALVLLRADRGMDCKATCETARMWCDATQFPFINKCEVMQQHFPCERGCDLVEGPDVPNYVDGVGLPTYQQCLVTDKRPKCDGSHQETFRLCPCIARE